VNQPARHKGRQSDTHALATRRSGQRGLTLIEITIALAIVALLFSAVVIGLGALTGTKAKATAGELAGVVRSLYDSAALSGKTCRLVFQLPTSREEGPTRYWAECAAGNITTSRNRDEAIRQEQQKLLERPSNQSLPPPGLQQSGLSAYQPSLQDLMAQERDRVEAAARYSIYTTPEIKPRQLPPSVKISVWTKPQREPIKSGTAYLYFFPQGFTEKAMLFVSQGNNVWTIAVQPLTGKAVVVGEQLEVPRS
jgi:general secretion pathway protein H